MNHFYHLNLTFSYCALFSLFVLQAHILEYGLAVHEKFVPQDMRPLHKKLVDQFHLMKSSLGIQVGIDFKESFLKCCTCVTQ